MPDTTVRHLTSGVGFTPQASQSPREGRPPMAYLIPFSSPRRRRRSSSRGDAKIKIALAVMCGLLLLAFAALGGLIYHKVSTTGDMISAWNRGVGHPDATLVTAGSRGNAADTIWHDNPGWHHCDADSCPHTGVYRYPVTVLIGQLRLDRGCYVLHTGRPLRSLMAAQKPGADTYSVALARDGRAASICSNLPSGPGYSDQVVIWSSDRRAPPY